MDAPRLTRVFVRGLLANVDASSEVNAAVMLLVSDAASDAVRAGESVTISGKNDDDGQCEFVVYGSGFTNPLLSDPPEGLDVGIDDTGLTIAVSVK